MSSVDNRIVNMQFNNKGFESGVATTLNSLKKLNESLKMKDASKGLNEVNNSLSKVNGNGISGLSKAVDAVTSRFSNLGVIATTALVNITNKAVDAGTKLVNALTLEPIMTGFSEYETKMGAIQTILTNTAHAGTSMKDVTRVLDDLNAYSDQTIYNFAEMTNNIGRFTAAGIDLDTSAQAIKGIANLAAASGSNSQQAATAMYQLSQALAAGKVSLMDWNSVVNAGMGGKIFQDSLIRTSEALGTGAESMIAKFGSFRESLTKGEWLTAEVLTETLKQLSGAYTEADLIAQGYTKSQAQEILKLAENATLAATEVKTVTQLFGTMAESVQSGWAKSWEYIIGDKEQATKALTAVNNAFSDMIGPSTEARNNMLKFWNEAGGRDDVIAGLGNVFKSLGTILGSVKDAFTEVFPPMTGEKIVELSSKFKDFTEKLKVNDETAAKIKDTFKGIFSVFGVVGDVVKGVFSVFSSGVGIFTGIGNVLLTVTSAIGKFFTSIREGLQASNIFQNAADIIKKGINGIGDILNSAIDGIKSFASSIGKLDFRPLLDVFKTIGDSVGKSLVSVFDGLGKSIGNINLNTLIGGLTALAAKGLFKDAKSGIEGFGKALDSFKGIGSNISGVLVSVRDTLKSYQSDLQAGTLIKIAAAIGILAASILLLSAINPADMENALVGITTLMIELVAAFTILMKLSSGKAILSLSGTATSLMLLSTALLLLSAAVKSLSSLSLGQLGIGLAGIAGGVLVLSAASQMMNTNSKGLITSSAAMLVLAGALVVLSSAVEKFGELNPSSMIQGLLGVGAVLIELCLFMKLTEANKMGITNSAGILLMASALLVFQNAVEQFGNMDTGNIIKGLAAMGGVLVELAAFTKLTSGSSGMLGTAAAMVVMAAAMNLMVGPMTQLGNLSWQQIAAGLVALAGALTILGVASAVISGAKLASVGAGLAVMSASMLLLSAALQSMGGMSWEQIAKSLVTLAGALVIFAAAMAVMSSGLAGAAAVLVMSAALAVLTPQLIAMANLSWGQIAAGLAMLAGTFVVFGVAGVALGPVTPVLIALAAAIALLGVGCAAAGIGVAAFATGMATLATVGAAGGFALAEILRQLISLIPEFASALAKGIVEFAKAIGEGMPALAKAMAQCMLGICDAIVEAIPGIIEAGLELLTALCEVLLEGLPTLVDTAVQMVLALVEGIASNIGAIVDVAIDLLINFLNAVGSKSGEIIQAGIDLAVDLINGLADGIRNNEGKVKDAIKNLGQALIDAFKSLLGIHSPSTVFNSLGVDTITGLINGITSKVSEVVQKISDMVNQMINTVKSKVGEFLSGGAQLIENLKNGISSRVSQVVENVRTCITNTVNAVKAKAGEFMTAGGQLIDKLKSGISSKASQIKTAFTDAVNKAKSAISGMASSFSSIGSNMMNGLKNGIQNAASSIASAAKNVVSKAIDAAKSALKIKSPSRVFMEIGDYTVQGFVKGLNDNAFTVDKPAVALAERAVRGVSDTVSSVARALSGEIDTDIVISPVMDLTNVEKGTRTINELLAANNNLVMNADVTGAITRSVGSIQNGSNNDRVIAAIKGLQDSLSNTGSTTYQINGITYDDGSNVNSAVETLIRAARIERRI